MEAVYSVYSDSVCYGRATTMKLARKIKSWYDSIGLSTEIEASFVYSREYEVDEMIQRLKKTEKH